MPRPHRTVKRRSTRQIQLDDESDELNFAHLDSFRSELDINWSFSKKTAFIVVCIVILLIVFQVAVFSHITTSASLFRFSRGLYYLYFAEKSKFEDSFPLVSLSSSRHTNNGNSTSAPKPIRQTRSIRTRCRLVPPNMFENVLGGTSDVANKETTTEANDDWSVSKNYSLRCLPNFLFIGASKCGTSSMRSHLVAHPGIRFVRRMQSGAEGAEVHRFDRWDFMFSNYLVEQALEWGHAPRVRNASTPVIHYTPHYLFDPAVPLRVKTFYHFSLKFLIMVRDPTPRAVSSYWFKRPNEKGGSTRDFIRSISSEISLRRRYERCVSSSMLPVSEYDHWIDSKRESWRSERESWHDLLGRKQNTDSNERSAIEPSRSAHRLTSATTIAFKVNFEPWVPGEWKRRGIGVSKRINAEKECLFRSIRAVNAKEVARQQKKQGSAEEDASLLNDDYSFNQQDGGGVLMRQHVAKGIYVEQLERWFDVFEGARRKFFILDLESFKRDEVATFDRICRFLRTTSVGSGSFATRQALQDQLAKRYNEGSNPNMQPIPDSVLHLLDKFYRPYSAALFDLIGEKFDTWGNKYRV